MQQALLDDIGAELVIRQTKHLLLDLTDHEQLIRGLPMLEHVWYHIVAVHVPCEVEDAFKDFVEDRPDLDLFTVLKHTLYDTATELMDRHLIDTGFKGVNDELDFIWRDLLDDFLDDMVAVRVFDATDDVRFDFLYNFVSEVRWEGIHGCLDHSAAILVTWKGNNVMFDHRKKGVFLAVGTEFEHFLNNIVAKNVFH